MSKDANTAEIKYEEVQCAEFAALDAKEREALTIQELEDYARSATEHAEIAERFKEDNQTKSFKLVDKTDKASFNAFKKIALAMYNVFKGTNGETFAFNPQNSSAITFTAHVLSEMSQGKRDSITLKEYHAILIAYGTQINGNLDSATAMQDSFALFAVVSSILNANTQTIQQMHAAYTTACDAIAVVKNAANDA